MSYTTIAAGPAHSALCHATFSSLINIPLTFWHEYCTVIQVGEKHISWRSATSPISRGLESSVPIMFETSYVWPKRGATKCEGVACFYGKPHSTSQGAGPSVPNFWTSYMHAHSMRNQILHGDQTRCEEIFTRSTTNADARCVCWTSC